MTTITIEGKLYPLATRANMRRTDRRTIAWSPYTNEEYSATADDYFALSEHEPLIDSAGNLCVLVRVVTSHLPAVPV